MKNTRRSLMVAASLMMVAVLFSLPSFLGQRPCVRYILDAVNRHIPGTLDVQSCSIGWWQGVRCEELSYRDQALGVRLTASRLAGDKGLFLLVVAPQYLGEITIDQPVLTVLPHSQIAASPDKPKVSAEQGTAIKAPWWEQLTFRLKVHKGVVALDQGQVPHQELARDIDLAGSLAVGTVNYTLAFRSGLEQQEGHLRAEGFINLPTARQSVIDALISRTEVEIKGLEIAAFLDLAASRGNFPRGKGVLDATWHVATAGMNDLEMQGETNLKELRLAGGFLGEDQPTLDHLLFKFKGSHKGNEGWRLATFNLESDSVRFEAKGSYDRAAASLAAKGSVNLPVVATQLPHLLSLHERTAIKEGVVDFTLNVAGTPQEFAVKAGCRTGRLTVIQNGQSFSWETPFSLVAEADHRQSETRVVTLQAHAPFFDSHGSGGAEDFALRATADLGRMFEELEKIFAFNVRGQGKVEITGSSKQQDDGSYRLDTRIDINDFALSSAGLTFLPSHHFYLIGEALAAPSFFQDGRFTSLRINGDSWPGQISLFARKSEQKTGAMHTSCSGNGVVNLERMNSFLHGLSGSEPPFALGGILSFDGSGEWDKYRVSLDALDGKVDRLTVTGKGYSHHEPRLTVSLTNKASAGTHPVKVRELMVADNWEDFSEKERPILSVDFQQQLLDLRHLTVEAAGAAAKGSLSLGNWRQPHPDFTAAISGTSTATLLTTLFKAAGLLSEDMALKGKSQATLKARSSGEAQVVTEVAVQIEPFELFQAKKKVFGDPRLVLKATFLGGGGEVAIPALILQTSPMQVEGTGIVHRNAAGPASLELQGNLVPNLSFFNDLLASVIGQRVVMAGKSGGIFLLSSPLPLPVAMNQMTLAARFPVDSLRIQGVELRQLDMPVEMNRGRLRAIIAGELNGGMVTLQPQWDLGSSRTEVRILTPHQILKSVPLEQPLIDGVLGRMHPLFGALARPEGAVDLRLDTFSLPVTAKGPQRPVFNATIGLQTIQLRPTKVLQDLLDLAGIEHAALLIKEREITCESKGGRISCSPVHLLAGETEIGISGSVGMDRTLACQLQLPVTEVLAGRVHLPLTRGGFVRAEMAGTLDAPFFNQETFLKIVADQLGKAVAEKAEQTAEQPLPDNQSGAGL